MAEPPGEDEPELPWIGSEADSSPLSYNQEDNQITCVDSVSMNAADGIVKSLAMLISLIATIVPVKTRNFDQNEKDLI